MCVCVCVDVYMHISLIDPSSTEGATLPTVQGEIEVCICV